MMNVKEPATPLDDLMPNWKALQAKALKHEKRRRVISIVNLCITGLLFVLMVMAGQFIAAAIFYLTLAYQEAKV